jgi:hypothetical protein
MTGYVAHVKNVKYKTNCIENNKLGGGIQAHRKMIS